MSLKLINRIEFHEKKSSSCRIPCIETRFHIEKGKLEEFLKYCIGEEKWKSTFGGKQSFDYKMSRVQKSRAKRPKFTFCSRRRETTIYPKEDLCISIECGLHYICQHSFDILPYEETQLFY